MRCVKPATDQFGVETFDFGARALLGHHCHHAVDQGRVALIQHDQQRERRTGRSDRRDSVASYSRSTAGVAPRRRIRRQASSPAANDAKPYAARRSAGGAGWTRSRRLGDHTERSFAADEELSQVGTGRRAGARPRRSARAGRRPAPPRGRRPCPRSCRIGSSTGRPSGRPASRPRSTARSTAASGRRSGPCSRSSSSSTSPNVPGRTLTNKRLVVDVGDAGQSGQVERDAAEHRDARAAHATAAGRGRHRDLGVVAAGEDGRHLGRRTGRATAAGRAGISPSRAHPIVSGHQSRPASTRLSSSTSICCAHAPQPVEQGLVHGDGAAAEIGLRPARPARR